MEDQSLELITPVPEERLISWLAELYNKPVTIARRKLLRHRDLSMVERLWIEDGLPESIIYKLVLPPWDIEQELHQRILIPSISNSAQLYLSGHFGKATAMFMEDLGDGLITEDATRELAITAGKELAKLHRAYSYRIDELLQSGILGSCFPLDYQERAGQEAQRLLDWNLIDKSQANELLDLAGCLAFRLAGETISLVHGDLYAENLIVRGDRLYIIDWSWFTCLGTSIMDLATITMSHPKNGSFCRWRDDLIEAYSFESGREISDVVASLPAAETLSRLLFLYWLTERRGRGILGTTVGPVDNLIPQLVRDLGQRLQSLEAGGSRSS